MISTKIEVSLSRTHRSHIEFTSESIMFTHSMLKFTADVAWFCRRQTDSESEQRIAKKDHVLYTERCLWKRKTTEECRWLGKSLRNDLLSQWVISTMWQFSGNENEKKMSIFLLATNCLWPLSVRRARSHEAILKIVLARNNSLSRSACSIWRLHRNETRIGRNEMWYAKNGETMKKR